MGTRRITFSLDRDSIGNAIEELRRFRTDYMNWIRQLVEALAEEGESEAKIQVAFMSAIDTGELQDSIVGYYDPDTHVGFVRTNCMYAAFVEYGTGVVGSRNPHPAPGGWVYDVNEHGDRGWTYFSERDGQFQWTKGVPYRPFMYETYKHLQRITHRLADQIFGNI